MAQTIIICSAGEFVAQFKALVMLMPNGNMKVTSADFEPTAYKTEHKIEDAGLQGLLQTSLSSKTKKKKKTKKTASETSAEAVEES